MFSLFLYDLLTWYLMSGGYTYFPVIEVILVPNRGSLQYIEPALLEGLCIPGRYTTLRKSLLKPSK